MKIAILGDVNANLPALEAVLTHAAELAVDEIWSTGNLLGYGGFPNEVVQVFQEKKIKTILGNLDLLVLKAKSNHQVIKKSKQPDYWLPLYCLYDQLTEENLKYIKSLETKLWSKAENRLIRLTSYSIEKKDFLSAATLRKKMVQTSKELFPETIFIYSQSAEPKTFKSEEICFIDAGSLGNSYDEHPLAEYSVLNLENEVVELQHYQVEYSQTKVSNIFWELIPSKHLADLQPFKLPQIIQEIAVSQEEAVILEEKAEKNTLLAINKMAQLYKYPREHSKTVENLALQLFDQLKFLHNLDESSRLILQYGAILHDIGWIYGNQKHHKTAANIIINTSFLPFEERERLLVALIARYHRKKLPREKHYYYASLNSEDKMLLKTLVALVRVADALDYTHQNNIKSIISEITADQIILHCSLPYNAEREQKAVLKKGFLLEELFKRKLVIQWNYI